MLKLFNTLSKKIEDFNPLTSEQVGLYTCGPTVYDFMHIGNLRTFLFSDTLYRVLSANGYKVKFIQNITDIDDKIIKKAKEENIPLSEITNKYTKFYFEDLKKLNITPADVYPKATEHVGKMAKYIEKLVEKGLAYVEEDGSVYFDISKFEDYGKLSGVEGRTLKTGTRILSRAARELRSSDEYNKDNIQDFALWKAVEADEKVGYDSPWGRGRPGWHIECSVMSQEYLGDTFDIHAGGVDLIFPHHENEIAQSEGYTGKKFVNFFLHGEHILVNGAKMSKSLKNFYTLKDLEKKGSDPMAYRYLVLTAHYRDKLNFTWESLQAASNALNKLREEIRGWPNVILNANKGSQDLDSSPLWGPSAQNDNYYQRFLDVLNNDLNTPQALAVLHEMISSNSPISNKAKSLLEMDKVLGLKLDEYLGKKLEIPERVKKLVEEREDARKQGNFEKSDELRKKIIELGFEIKDTPKGPKIT
ncbi:cysteine--tRNA ligase [Candidatus Daviesbacteria bacterium]|nr:cysteine--tRNA ligase [Candidatus Daviesbacteria bacterium]